MSKSRAECKLALEKFLEKSIRERVYPGAVVGVLWPGGDQTMVAVGRTRYGDEAGIGQTLTRPVSIESVFDTASITKSVVTTTLSLLAVERGWWELDQPLAELVPWQEQLVAWGQRSALFETETITLHHLLTHSLDMANLRMSALKDLPADQIRARLLGAVLTTPPGLKHTYINSTSILNSLILETLARHHGQAENLAELFESWLVEPLQLESSWLGGVEAGRDRIAPSELDPWRGREILGEIHDESAWKFAQAGQLVGSAGLFSSAPDLLKFLAWLRDLPSQSALAPSKLAQSQLMESTVAVGLGWELAPREWLGQAVSPTTIGKTGFTGCSLSLDSTSGLGVVFLNNHIYPRRPADREVITRNRAALHDLIISFVPQEFSR